MTRFLRRLAAVTAVALLVAACGGDDDAASSDGGPDDAAGAETLAGVLSIAAGACDGDATSGSWFRMVQPGGTVADGPFVENPDSVCSDTAVTLLAPGADGGLTLGAYQPQPDPAFGEGGVSNANAIITPAPFFAVPFGLSTNETDPQSGDAVPAPVASAEDGVLTADLTALSVSWNEQHFNQGAVATGTYDADTGAFTLDWTAQIVGGPFNNFTGIWHLEGVVAAG